MKEGANKISSYSPAQEELENLDFVTVDPRIRKL